MSERGSFVTEYIYCNKCLEAAKSVLIGHEKHLCSTVLPGWHPDQPYLPIIAGKIGGLYEGEELHSFECALNKQLAAVLCHPLRIAVLAEAGEQIFKVEPEKMGEL